MDIDKYKRLVCVVWIDGRDVGQELVREGAAWAYLKYLQPPFFSEYSAAEQSAKASGVGLWSNSVVTPPWDFRKESQSALKGF